jgi:hypothetical protein
VEGAERERLTGHHESVSLPGLRSARPGRTAPSTAAPGVLLTRKSSLSLPQKLRRVTPSKNDAGLKGWLHHLGTAGCVGGGGGGCDPGGLAVQEQEELWRRWRQGESLRLIARQMGKRGPSIRAFVADRWRAAAPPAACGPIADSGRARGDQPRHRCRRLQQGIAKRLRRAPSTVSRELARNGGRSRYRAQRADAAANRRAARPKPFKLVTEPQLRAVVEAKLTLRWSPEQIAGWLQMTYPTIQPCASATRPST